MGNEMENVTSVEGSENVRSVFRNNEEGQIGGMNFQKRTILKQ